MFRTDLLSRQSAVLVWTATVVGLAAAGTVLSWPIARYAWWVDLPLHAFGALVAVAGGVIWRRTSLHRVGQLIIVVAATFHLGDLRASAQPVVFAIGFCFGYLWVAVLAHLALAWPTGRVAGRLPMTLAVLGYVSAVATQVVRYVVDDPRGPMGYDMGGAATPASMLGSALVLLLGEFVLGLLAYRWMSASRLRRRPSAAVWASFIVLLALALSLSVASLVGEPAAKVQFGLLVAGLLAGLFLVPISYLAYLVRTVSAQARLASINLHLDHGIGTHISRKQLQRLLSDALGDPDVRLFVEGEVPGDIGSTPAGRVRTPVRRGDRLLCTFEHDESLAHQPAVAGSAEAAIVMAIERTEVFEQLRRKVTQLHEAGQQIAETAAQERRRIQGDLHDQAQGPLLAVLSYLSTATIQMDAGHTEAANATVLNASEQLNFAIGRLSDLINAEYCPALLAEGLAAAVEEIAGQTPLPIEAQVPHLRWSEHLEYTAYCLISEAVNNVQKHARASRATITVHDDPDWLTIAVADDGIGLPVELSATDMRRLWARTTVAGGQLHICRTGKHGTLVTAKLPKETE
jgi:signal transduction histidine kinase